MHFYAVPIDILSNGACAYTPNNFEILNSGNLYVPWFRLCAYTWANKYHRFTYSIIPCGLVDLAKFCWH